MSYEPLDTCPLFMSGPSSKLWQEDRSSCGGPEEVGTGYIRGKLCEHLPQTSEDQGPEMVHGKLLVY